MEMKTLAPIVMLTDFGTHDPYVGILKGVIAGIAPEIPMIDLTHEILPGDLLQGAVTLWMSRTYFPPGTVFCCVVDPGVGTARRAILIESGGQRFIGPDNGLFSFVTEEDSSAWRIEASEFRLPVISSTFHGRDVFAPAAAHAALGVAGSSFGRPAKDLVRLMQPHLQSIQNKALEGEILFADRFGNLLTSLGIFKQKSADGYLLEPWLKEAKIANPEKYYSMKKSRLILQGGRALDWVSTFADKPKGEPAILVGSSGLLEVVANQASAAQMLDLNRGDRITLLQTGDE
jgi:S-adenosyl-L-methionine hydrolase (adenosine-forming)